MRDDYPKRGTSVLTWILSALVAGFVLQNVFGRWFGSNLLETIGSLHPATFRQGFVWTLVTYTLLQPGILSLLFNGLGVFMLGRELLPLLGARRFMGVYLGAAITGGLLWLGVHSFTGGGALIGATSCALALFITFACFYPNREITFLLFFVLPVTVKPKYLAYVLIGVDVLGFLFSELPGARFDTGMSHSANLGGMLAGWVYFRFFHANNGWDRASSIELPAWLRRRKKAGAAPLPTKVNLRRPSADLRVEVDRILDKINSQGFGALTEQEKKVLDDAKDLLSRP
jgi:membrane associated rhomboid family serine protease